MYAVIFRAEINESDEAFSSTAIRMRELAINEYGCKEFISCCEGNLEVAISYWESKEQIKAWKNNPEHLEAQSLGKAKWYKNYQVQIVKVLREYGTST
jgi:heme-degrading monooxygenase HmoA